MKMRQYLILALLLLAVTVESNRRVHRAKRHPERHLTNTQGKRGLAELVASLLPNTYYSRPKFRYPYYRSDGKAI